MDIIRYVDQDWHHYCLRSKVDPTKTFANFESFKQAKADKKSSRVAADGRIVVSSNQKYTVIIEVNSETDFVAKNEDFIKFVKELKSVYFTPKKL